MKIYPKLNEAGIIQVDDNNLPVFIFEEKDGSKDEKGVDVPSMFGKITELNSEAKNHRLAKQKYADKIKILEDAEIDLEKLDEFVNSSKENAKKISSFNEKDYKSIEEIEKIKKGVGDSFTEKIEELKKQNDLLQTDKQKIANESDELVRTLLIKSAFDSSPFIREKTVLTPDIAFNTFGRDFKVEKTEGQLIPSVYAIDSSGEKIWSKTNPGDYANTEEAIEILIKKYPQSEAILKPSSGGPGGNPSQSSNRKYSPEQLANMSPTERLKLGHSMKK